MPYISFATQPQTIGVGRSARHVSFKNDTGSDWVGEVDEVLAGETEISEAAFTSRKGANDTYNAALPAPPLVVPPTPPVQMLVEKVAAIDTSKVVDVATAKAVIEEFQTAVVEALGG